MTDATVVESRWTRSVVAFLASTLGSSAASNALTTVVGVLVFDMTKSELDLGLLGLAEFAPAALLVLVTGTLADRLDRRRLAAAGLFGESVAVLGLAAYSSTDPSSVAPIFALVVLFGVARAFAMPPARALPPDVVPTGQVPWLMIRRSAAWQIALIVGPLFGGVMYTIDVTATFVVIALMLAASGAAILTVHVFPRPSAAVAAAALSSPVEVALDSAVEVVEGPPPVPPIRARLSEALEGLRLVRHRPALLGAISLDLFAVLFGGAVALLPAIAEERLGVGAVGLGVLRAAIGIGAAAVTVGLMLRPLTRNVGRTLFASVALFGIFTILLGATTSYVVAFVSLMFLSGADAMSVFIRSTLVPLLTPNEARGRVLAVENVFIGASNELGAFESGVTGQVLGPAPAIMLGGFLTLAVAAAWSRLFPSIREIDAFPDG